MAYIDQKAAVDAVKKVIGNLDHECKPMMDFYSALWNVPAADVAPVVHGRWENFRGKPKCSQCKAVWPEDYFGHNYCPRCGAKMDGGKA